LSLISQRAPNPSMSNMITSQLYYCYFELCRLDGIGSQTPFFKGIKVQIFLRWLSNVLVILVVISNC